MPLQANAIDATAAPSAPRRGLPRIGGGTASRDTAQPPSDGPEADPAPAEARAGVTLAGSPEELTSAASSTSTPHRPDVLGSLEGAPKGPKTIGRFTRGQRVLRSVIAVGGLVVLAAAAVFFARWFVSLDFMRDFMRTYPGQSELPAGAPVGLPAWLGWQHFLNMFFMVLIIRSGWQVRTQARPPAMWVRNNAGRFKTKNPPKRISISLWSHYAFDTLWLMNGITFVILLFATGQWMRVVPTSWDVFPNAISAALQYLSLDWPTDNGWVNYNSLQVLAYFVTIFIAAPLAAITGIRMSGAWPAGATRLNKLYPVEWARAVHLPVMFYFVLFIIVHVALVLSTGALRNLNHMYAAQDAVNWSGFGIFVASLVVIVGGVFAARPIVFAPIAGLMGKVTR